MINIVWGKVTFLKKKKSIFAYIDNGIFWNHWWSVLFDKALMGVITL